jgi:hypothetical protein
MICLSHIFPFFCFVLFALITCTLANPAAGSPGEQANERFFGQLMTKCGSYGASHRLVFHFRLGRANSAKAELNNRRR